MRLVIQRVSQAHVTVNHQTIGQIQSGFLVLVGFATSDTPDTLKKASHKLLNLRILPDDLNRLNRSIIDIQGELLIVSQFTLYADLKGHRPGFSKSAPPAIAQEFYLHFLSLLQPSGLKIQTGQFGAEMEVSLTNTGPVTIIMDL